MDTAVLLRPFAIDDLPALAAAGERLSADSLQARFRSGFPTLPASYLTLVRTNWPHRWDAVVAARGGEIVGWADCGRNDDGSVDLAVCVVDAEQRHGLGERLLVAALDRCRQAGADIVHTDIERSNAAARHAWERAVPVECSTGRVASGTSIRFSADLSRWPLAMSAA